MQLKIYDQKLSYRVPLGKPSLRVDVRGTIRLDAGAVHFFKLKAKDTIAIAQDEKAPEDWYLLINPAEDDYVTRVAGGIKTSQSLIVNASLACKDLLKQVKVCQSASFYIATVATEPGMYAILTTNPMKVK